LATTTQKLIGISVFLGFCGIAFGAHVFMERRRRRAMRDAADSLGLSYQESDDSLVQTLRHEAALFDRGQRRRATNVMTGTVEDLRLYVFDYAYSTGGGKSKSRWKQTVVAFTLPDASLPRFQLSPERFYHRIAAWVGWDDIDFPDHPEFSKQYRLTAEPSDDQAVRDRFTYEIIAALQTLDRLSVASGGDWLIVFRHNRRVKPSDVHAFLDDAFSICNRLA